MPWFKSYGLKTVFVIGTLSIMAATVPSALMARVIAEGLIDPTKHNLWSLIILIAAVVGYLSTAPDVVIGHLICRLRQTHSGSSSSWSILKRN